jgi:hypothetical protein
MKWWLDPTQDKLALAMLNIRDRLATRFHAGIFLGLVDPEEIGDIFLRNVGLLSTEYTTLHPRR